MTSSLSSDTLPGPVDIQRENTENIPFLQTIPIALDVLIKLNVT
jgi:hypothetical protein